VATKHVDKYVPFIFLSESPPLILDESLLIVNELSVEFDYV